MGVPTIKILELYDRRNGNKVNTKIKYYDQNSLLSICTISGFIPAEIREQLFVGKTFDTYDNFRKFLNMKKE